MAAFGVVILVVVAAVVVTVVGGGGEAVRLDPLGIDVNTTGAGAFGLGAASAAVGALGLYLLLNGMRRGANRRREVRELRREAGREPDGSPAATRPDTQPGARSTDGEAAKPVPQPPPHSPQPPPYRRRSD